MKNHPHLAGIALMVSGMLLFTLNDALGKWLVADYSVGQILAIRSAAALLILVPYLWRQGHPDRLQPGAFHPPQAAEQALTPEVGHQD